MIKVRIEATNMFILDMNNEHPIDYSEVVDSQLDSSSNFYEYLDLFIRAMVGMGFNENHVKGYLQEYYDGDDE